MGTEYGYFKVQQFESPLLNSVLEKSNQICDPALTRCIEFINGMLILHLSDYWTALISKIKLPNNTTYKDLNIDFNNIVAESIQYDPEQYFQTAQYKFPLLCLFRTEEEKFEKTVAWYCWKGIWKFRYILPPLTSAQANTLVPVLNAIKYIVNDRIEQGYDPNFAGGENWFDGYISQISVQKATFGTLQNPQTNLIFPTLEMDIYFEEREQKHNHYGTLDGIDGYVDCVTDGYDTLTNFIEYNQDLTI